MIEEDKIHYMAEILSHLKSINENIELINEIEQLDTILNLKEALEFYAAEENWDISPDRSGPDDSSYLIRKAPALDRGKRAREALGKD